MINRAKLGLVTLSVVCAVFIWWRWPREREPVYGGKSLSYWVLSEGRGAPDIGQREAIRGIGTNALPFLIKWMQLKPRPWLRHVFGLVPDVTRFDHREELAMGSIAAFRVLGARASPAISELVSIARGTNVHSALRALVCIEYTGRAGVPAVLDIVTNRSAYCPDSVFSVLGTMGYLGTNADFAIPGLISLMSGSDPHIAAHAAALLGEIKRQPDCVVPALASATTHPSEEVRFCAIHSLGRFQREARAAIPSLLVSLNDPVMDVRKVATNSLLIIEGKALGDKLDN